MTDSTSNKKAERKISAAAVTEQGTFEETAYGRRRSARIPKPLAIVFWFVASPFVYVYKRLRRHKPSA